MDNLLAKFFSGEASEEEKAEVLQWRSENDANAEAFFETKRAWIEIQRPSEAADQDRLAQILEAEAKTAKQRALGIPPMLRYAAVVLLVAATVLVLYRLKWDSYNELITEIKLEDGSTAVLYKGAELEVVSFDDIRKVSVSGKVYFDVKSDESRPFIILTDEAKVEVLGTSFLVDATEQGKTQVAVESGLVNFGQNPEKSAGQKITTISLKEGEQGLIYPNAKGVVKQRIQNVNYLAWMNRVISFDRNNMKEVADIINEVYGYEVEFTHEQVLRCRLSAKFNQKSVEDVAKIISATFGLEYKINKKKVTFSGKGC
ncbi:MAG: FecR domain-containing protein [Cyclobacteriaceae bacterium]|nr:FecR domain-containing protein [Cyclobacteriaceae bacterium HetDA_MAG_MS6]